MAFICHFERKFDMIIFLLEGYIIETCRNCKREIEGKLRQCPYCGILNPTVKLKDIFIGIAVVLIAMSIYMVLFT